MGDGKRRLPVLPSTPEGDDGSAPPRPGWQWSLIGAVAIVIAWLPLAALANAVLAKTVLAAGEPSPSQAATLVVVNGGVFAIASFAGGYMIGRFGTGSGLRDAAVAGVLAAAVGCAMAIAQRGSGLGAVGWFLVVLVVCGIGAGGAFAGGRLGVRRR